MSRIEELIREKCPDGVEYKRIESLVTYKRGKGLSKDDKGTGDNPIILYGELYTTYGDYINTIVSYASDEAILTSVKIHKGDVVLPISSTTKEAQIGKASVLRCDNASLSGDAVAFTPQLEIMAEYLMYVMNSGFFENSKMKCVKGVTIRHLDAFKMMLIEIPVPPIEVQQEIVRILDKFTELEAELQAELDARKKQYEYYRDKLLNFGDNVEYRSLGDSCYIKARIGWQKLNKSEYLSEGDYYLVTGVNITKANRVNFDECYFVSKERYEMDVNIQLQNGDIIITKDGTIGKVALIEEMDKPAVLNSHLFVIRDITGKLNHKFLLYVFLSNYFTRFVEGNKTSGTIAGLNQATMVKFNIPFPSLDEQERIVEILDKFVQLIERLTKEIEIRHKQYEYYRDKLLTFKRKEV